MSSVSPVPSSNLCSSSIREGFSLPSSDSALQAIANIGSTVANSKDTFEARLQEWVCGKQALDERKGRLIAKHMMLCCYNEKGTSLNLSWLGLTSLPDAIEDLTNLRKLYCHGNKLTSLPTGIIKLLRQLQPLSDDCDNLYEYAYPPWLRECLETLQTSMKGFWNETIVQEWCERYRNLNISEKRLKVLVSGLLYAKFNPAEENAWISKLEICELTKDFLDLAKNVVKARGTDSYDLMVAQLRNQFEWRLGLEQVRTDHGAVLRMDPLLMAQLIGEDEGGQCFGSRTAKES